MVNDCKKYTIKSFTEINHKKPDTSHKINSNKIISMNKPSVSLFHISDLRTHKIQAGIPTRNIANNFIILVILMKNKTVQIQEAHVDNGICSCPSTKVPICEYK